jgi:hypothetical protein
MPGYSLHLDPWHFTRTRVFLPLVLQQELLP